MISVLYIDDEPDLLDLGKLYLEENGLFRVTTSVTVTPALDPARESRFDAIISDFQMPDMDGIVLLRKIRSTSDIPFILFTGRGREEVVIDAINNGADFYLQKGGNPSAQFAELGHKIQQAVTRRRVEKDLRKRLDLIRQTSEISTRFIRMTGEEIDGAILETLELVGTRCGADRCYLALLDTTGAIARITHEWTFPGVSPVADTFGVIRMADIPWFNRILTSFEIISIPRVRELQDTDDEVGQEKKRLLAQDVRSLLLIPLTIGPSVIGAIGLDAVRREITWPEEDTDILKIYGQIITNALSRKTADTTIRESGDLYRAVFDATGTAMLILDEDMTITHINREVERIVGISRTDIEGRMKWTELVPAENLDRMMAYHQMRRKDPLSIPTHYEFDFISKDGKIFNTFLSATMIPGSTKSIISLIDITREKTFQRDVLDSEEKFRILAESLPEGIYMIQDRRFIFVNPVFARLFGRSADELLALPDFLMLFPENDRLHVLAAIDDRLSGKSDTSRYTVQGIRPDGTIFTASVHGALTRYKGKPAIIGTMTELRMP